MMIDGLLADINDSINVLISVIMSLLCKYASCILPGLFFNNEICTCFINFGIERFDGSLYAKVNTVF